MAALTNTIPVTDWSRKQLLSFINSGFAQLLRSRVFLVSHFASKMCIHFASRTRSLNFLNLMQSTYVVCLFLGLQI